MYNGIPDRQTLTQFLDQAIQIEPLAAGVTFDAILAEVDQLNLLPGTPVMVSMSNGLPFVYTVFALVLCGLVPVLLPSAAPACRLQRMAEVLGGRHLIAAHLLPKSDPAFKHTQTGRCVQYLELAIGTPSCYEPGQIILLTSGTSGIFSGCLFPFETLLRNARRHSGSVGQTATDKVLISLPMYYSYAFVAQLLASLVSESAIVITGPPFTPAQYQQTLSQHGITLSSLTPVMLQACQQADVVALPKSLRALTVGGDVMPPALVAEVLARNPDLELYLTYGLTQAGPRVSTLAAHREPVERYGSVGLPLPEVEVFLRRQTPEDETGELVVTTDTAMLRKIGVAGASDIGDGRVNTGDIFEMDAEGYLYFKKRQPTFVFNGGEKIYLPSICEIAESIPGVVRAQAWVQGDAESNSGFSLDLYCDGSDLTEKIVRRELAKTLLRAEQPALLRLHPASAAGWKKTASTTTQHT